MGRLRDMQNEMLQLHRETLEMQKQQLNFHCKENKLIPQIETPPSLQRQESASSKFEVKFGRPQADISSLIQKLQYADESSSDIVELRLKLS